MTTGVPKEKLGDLFDFKNGRAFKKTEWRNEGLPIIRIKNLNDSQAPFNFFQGGYDKAIEVNDGDLLFSWSGTVGSSFGSHIWERGKGVLNQHIFRVSFKKPMVSKYAYYALREITAEIEKSVNGAVGLVHVNKSDLNNFSIPVPTLEEQERIVAILDEAFGGIAIAVNNSERNLENAKELFQSILQSTFEKKGEGWSDLALGDLCDVLDRLRRPITKRDRVPGPYPYYGATGVLDYVDGFLFDEPLVLIGEDGAKWGSGDQSAFSVSGKTWVNNHAHVIKPDRSKVLDDWLIFYLNYANLDDFISGMTVPKLNQGQLRKIPIPVPQIGEQEAAISKLRIIESNVRRLESIYLSKLEDLAELRQSLLQKAFAGEL